MENVIYTLIGLACTVIGGIIGYVSFFRTSKKESANEGRETGVMFTEMGYIKSGIDDIKTELRDQRKINSEFSTRLAKVEGSASRAHERIDEHLHAEHSIK